MFKKLLFLGLCGHIVIAQNGPKESSASKINQESNRSCFKLYMAQFFAKKTDSQKMHTLYLACLKRKMSTGKLQQNSILTHDSADIERSIHYIEPLVHKQKTPECIEYYLDRPLIYMLGSSSSFTIRDPLLPKGFFSDQALSHYLGVRCIKHKKDARISCTLYDGRPGFYETRNEVTTRETIDDLPKTTWLYQRLKSLFKMQNSVK